jgi:hypothetical protein
MPFSLELGRWINCTFTGKVKRIQVFEEKRKIKQIGRSAFGQSYLSVYLDDIP